MGTTSTLKLPGVIANYHHSDISSSHMLPGCFRTSKKGQLQHSSAPKWSLATAASEAALLHPFGLSKPNPTKQQMEGNVN